MIDMKAGEALARRRRVQVRHAFHLRCRHHSKKQAAVEPVKAHGRTAVHRHAEGKHLGREPAVEFERHFRELVASHSFEWHFLKLGIRSVDVNAVPVSNQKTADDVVKIFMGHINDAYHHRLLVSCYNIAPNASGEAYQLWFVTPAGYVSAGLMPMTNSEPMTMVLQVPADAPRVTGAAMSIEPRAGSRTVTGPVVFERSL